MKECKDCICFDPKTKTCDLPESLRKKFCPKNEDQKNEENKFRT